MVASNGQGEEEGCGSGPRTLDTYTPIHLPFGYLHTYTLGTSSSCKRSMRACRAILQEQHVPCCATALLAGTEDEAGNGDAAQVRSREQG